MLYIVATPIGNLDDLSIRQAKTLINSHIILAEDTRSAQTLLNACRLGLQLPKVISYYKEKELEKLPFIINMLKQNKKVSLISESGMPLISDPGYLLVKTAIKENLSFEVIPGPSAVTTALIYSGFNPKQFMFLGYFPKKQSAMFQLINQLKQIHKIFPETIFVFYESPKRINNTLQCFKTSKWNSDIVIGREMTKKFEEVIRGKAKDLLKRRYKGELTVVIK
jgi:16S rRNA (cytidine1402-2'-O)-methyltransferase